MGIKFQTLLFLILTIIDYGELKNVRISAGKVAGKKQFPFFAQLKLVTQQVVDGMEIQYKHWETCGASLIHPKWILTVAHCFSYYKIHLDYLARERRLLVYMGTNIMYNAYVNWIKKVYIHDKYVGKMDAAGAVIDLQYDVAVASLQKNYVISKIINVVYLPPPVGSPGWRKVCRVGQVMGVGRILSNKTSEDWGFPKNVLFTDIHPKTYTELKQKQYVPKSKTGKVFYAEIGWTQGHNMLWDSGGPFVCNFNGSYVQYGIASTVQNIYPDTISMFENVDSHIDFISRIVPDITMFSKETMKSKRC